MPPDEGVRKRSGELETGTPPYPLLRSKCRRKDDTQLPFNCGISGGIKWRLE